MKYLLALLLLTTPAFACSDVDNYTAQFKLQEMLPHQLFQFDGMTHKELGDEHWWLRIKAHIFADNIKDTCVKYQFRDYLTSENLYLEQYLRDGPEMDSRETQKLAEKKKESLNWPKY